jgi:hypothetical protein
LVALAHTLQLVIHDGIFTQVSVEKLVKKSRKIVTHFKHSEQACKKLIDCQKSCEVVEHKLLQDVETRWNSTYIMLERLVEQRKSVNLFSVENGGFDTLLPEEWELAERVVKILQPYYEATLDISADNACVSIAIPLIALLEGNMQSTDEDRGLLQMKAALRDALKRRFIYLKRTPYIAAATLLDPRFKDAYFNPQETALAKMEMNSFLRTLNANRAPETETLPQAQLEPATSQAATRPRQQLSLWDAHDNLPIVTQPEANPAEQEPAHQLQLEAYLKAPRMPRSTDIYGYWHCSQFPSLEAAALKYLSAPPSSVASEQLFSSAGQLYADRRNCLHGENAEKLLFLAYNIRLLDFNY